MWCVWNQIPCRVMEICAASGRFVHGSNVDDVLPAQRDPVATVCFVFRYAPLLRQRWKQRRWSERPLPVWCDKSKRSWCCCCSGCCSMSIWTWPRFTRRVWLMAFGTRSVTRACNPRVLRFSAAKRRWVTGLSEAFLCQHDVVARAVKSGVNKDR